MTCPCPRSRVGEGGGEMMGRTWERRGRGGIDDCTIAGGWGIQAELADGAREDGQPGY